MRLRKPDDFYREVSKVFRRAPVGRDAIKGWAIIAAGKAKDAMNKTNSPSTRLGAAYDAVFNLSLAVLLSNGWRCGAADGHHVQALEASCAYADVTQTVFDEMDAVRDLRNEQYDGRAPTEADVRQAIKSMERLAPVLLALVAEHLR